MSLPFQNRIQAGRALAAELSRYAGQDGLLALALPRGGVPVAAEVARALGCPLDVFLVRKLGVPGHEELAMGAIASGGVRVVNQQVVRSLGVSQAVLDQVSRQELAELRRRRQQYRDDRPEPAVAGRTVLLVDDGLATGSTMAAAVAALRQMEPERVVVAVPVASREACRALGRQADEVVCVATPEPFMAVGYWYDDFTQTSDEEVQRLLSEAGGGGSD